MLVKEFAKLVGISAQAVNKRLKANKPHKAIKGYRKFANTYDLEIDAEEFQKLILKRKQKAELL